MKNKITKLLTASAVLATSSMASGATLQFDFGLAQGVFAGTDAPAGLTSPIWNGGINADIGGVDGGTLVDIDGNATSVTLDIGSGANGAADFFDGGVGNSSNTDAGNGILGTALYQDWIFTNQNNNLGVRLSGLESGEYDVFALVREPNELGRIYDVGIGVGDTSDIDALTVQGIGVAANNDAFVAGQNFVQQRVTITDTSDFITVLVDPTNADFGTLAGLQIVAVPEPSSVTLLGLGFMGFVLRRKR